MKYCSSCGEFVVRKTPEGDTHERWACEACETIHYQNPRVVVGCVPAKDGKVLLCKRSIEPRYGYWTVPAGFMEIGETIAQGAARETMEEACAEVEIGHLFASVDVVQAGQLHLFFTAELVSDFSAGEESLDVAMFEEEKSPGTTSHSEAVSMRYASTSRMPVKTTASTFTKWCLIAHGN